MRKFTSRDTCGLYNLRPVAPRTLVLSSFAELSPLVMSRFGDDVIQ